MVRGGATLIKEEDGGGGSPKSVGSGKKHSRPLEEDADLGEGVKHQQKKGPGASVHKEKYFVSPPPVPVHQLLLGCSVALCGNQAPRAVREQGLLEGVVRDLQAVAPGDLGLPEEPAQIREGGSRNVSIYDGEELSVEALVLVDGAPLVLELKSEVVAVCRCLAGSAEVRFFSRADPEVPAAPPGKEEARRRKQAAAQADGDQAGEDAKEKEPAPPVRVQRVEGGGEGVWTAKTEPEVLEEGVFLSIEAKEGGGNGSKKAGGAACVVLLVMASREGGHRDKQCYAVKADDGEGGGGGMGSVVLLEQVEAHEALKTSAPYAGKAWGPLAVGTRMASSFFEVGDEEGEVKEEED